MVKRYHVSAVWLADHVFQPPRFQKILRAGPIVMYPREGVKTYTCNPVPFAKFMVQWFPEIARAAGKREEK
ncbi:DUF771 domain-containing protein [Schleiferilactobacillus harbinensis]|uniref:DUF771 domain-containing protein n=1 Tax=Schleiferilactobacillus harbinensis TaxID=304207 RepID=A0A5P8M9H8_9LACO|nr:DUF771 domain-containing protein [Schleiferilactobacillus harbinensis]